MIQTIVCTPAVIAEEKVPAVVNIIETVESVDSSSSSISPDEQNDAIDTINDLLLDRLKKIPEEPLVGYPASTRGAGDYVYYTAKDLDRFTDCAVYDLIAQGLKINVRTHHIKIINHILTVIFRIPRRTRLLPFLVHQIWTMSLRYLLSLEWDMGFFSFRHG
jgi:hypothetical protein